jgi:phosphatidylinositol alpha-1,6-mannosyltransferase
MRILMLTADFPPDVGGIQTYSHELARRLAARAAAFELMAPWRKGCEDVDRQSPFTVRRVRVPSDGLALSGIAAVSFAARRLRADVVFATHWSCAHAAGISRRLSGYPRHIGTAAHGRELIGRPFARSAVAQRFYDALRRRALSRSDVLFPISRYTASLLETFDVQRVSVVNNGVNAIEFQPDRASGAGFRARHGLGSGPLLMTIGRLVERKGIDTVIAALPGLARDFPELGYAVVGGGPDRARLEALAREHGVAERVKFLGVLPAGELAHAYNACDIFVMPARSDGRDVEGFGLVFLEASACGKPVVGARSGGVPDAVIEGQTGYLVEPGSPPELAQRLGQLLESPALCAELGQGGRSHVVNTGTWDHAADKIHSALGGPWLRFASS